MTLHDTMEDAGRYVIGLMDDLERDAFEARLDSDPALVRIIDSLTASLSALDETAASESVNSDLWSQISTRLDALPTGDAPSTATVTALLAPKARAQSPYQWMAIAASVLVALGIGYLGGSSTTVRPEPVVVAVLVNQATSHPGAVIEAFGDDSVRVLPLENFVVPDGRILQVWTLPDPATGPVSLGTLATAQNRQLSGPHLPAPKDGQLYEITLEPAPGSPTGRPTGPILVKGFARLAVNGR